uniref:Uncharacterized protein n=1 Tax=Oryza brachyantha TaxID=4533 RepID=J3LBG2_ORYBR
MTSSSSRHGWLRTSGARSASCRGAQGGGELLRPEPRSAGGLAGRAGLQRIKSLNKSNNDSLNKRGGGSGAAVSMPSMTDTVLNLGLNDQSTTSSLASPSAAASASSTLLPPLPRHVRFRRPRRHCWGRRGLRIGVDFAVGKNKQCRSSHLGGLGAKQRWRPSQTYKNLSIIPLNPI